MESLVSPLDFFRLLVQDENTIPLFEAAASIATDADPTLDLEQLRTTFDVMAIRLGIEARNASTENARLGCLLRFFFDTARFAGNAEDYYSPDNSYLHRVLETRRGIPITLSVVLLELARHIGLDADGVSFPGHFLVRVKLGGGLVVIDPFPSASAAMASRATPGSACASSTAPIARPSRRVTPAARAPTCAPASPTAA